MAEESQNLSASSSRFYLSNSLNADGQSIGNGIFAGINLKAGEEITTLRRPLVASLDTERLPDTCANCYVWTEGSAIGSRLYVKDGTIVQTCAGCKRFRYCGQACQKEAWKRGHKHECKNLRPVSDKDIPKAVLATMELLIRKKHGLISENQWDLLCRLQSHIDDFKQNGKYGGIELMALGTSQFSFTQDTFPKDFVAAMYARVLTNSLTLVTPTFDPLGIVIDPILGHLNHSCDPNAYIVMDGAETAIRTLKPIKRDEEVFISYIDTTNPYTRRKSELEARWFFTCKCSKCQKGPTLDEDNWKIGPQDLAETEKKRADRIIQLADFAHEPASYVGDLQDERRVAAIQAEAFNVYEEEQKMADPEEAIVAIEMNGMHLCYRTELWPVYRQPYAALRDDLIVNLLAVGKYKDAWAHCAKRYKYILPKLYPQSTHPVRVVQTWQMAMLALYLASSREGVGAADVDMPLIAMLLVTEVMHASKLSHGPNSAFATSVKKKLKELTVEFRAGRDPMSGKEMESQVMQQRTMLDQMSDWPQY